MTTSPTTLGLTDAERQLIRDGLDRLVSDLDGTGELEKLEDSLREFNMFEALGTINAEIRHSNFLAWLFDPNGSHGLGDLFVKRFLQRSLVQLGDDRPLTPIDLDLMDLSDLEVRREWGDIDLLLRSVENEFVVVIENKIRATESRGQLEKYRTRIMKEFPSDEEGSHWRHLFLFLTIDGNAPSDGAFVPISYGQVVELLDATIRNQDSALPPDVKMAIRHYVRMLRRQHMEDSELIRLARIVYAKHRPALDFIFENRPDNWSDTRDIVVSRLAELPVRLEFTTATFVRFLPRAWEPWNEWLSQGTGWKSGGCDQLMLCEIRPDAGKERARLQLVLGPGPTQTRDKLIGRLKEAQVFGGKAYPSWTTLASRQWRNLEENGHADPLESASELIEDVGSFLSDESYKVTRALEMAFGEI